MAMSSPLSRFAEPSCHVSPTRSAKSKIASCPVVGTMITPICALPCWYSSRIFWFNCCNSAAFNTCAWSMTGWFRLGKPRIDSPSAMSLATWDKVGAGAEFELAVVDWFCFCCWIIFPATIKSLWSVAVAISAQVVDWKKNSAKIISPIAVSRCCHFCIRIFMIRHPLTVQV